MPIYRYRCESCHHTSEVIAKVSDPPPERCDRCGVEGGMKRLLARTSFQLKGGGWYSQGYEGASNQGQSGSTSSDSSSASSSDASSSSSSSSSSGTSSSSGDH